MQSHELASSVAFGVLPLGLGFVAFVRQPLKVGEVVVVAGDDVVALRTHPVASGGVAGGLASAACSAIDGMGISTVAGTLGGDDTGFICMFTNEDALQLCEEIKSMMK